MVDYDKYWLEVEEKRDKEKTARALRRSEKLRAKKYGPKKPSKSDIVKRRIHKTRKSYKYHLLKELAIRRAGGRCSLCCALSDDLIAHHIEMVKDAPNRILDEKNVVAICRLCHKEIHPWLR